MGLLGRIAILEWRDKTYNHTQIPFPLVSVTSIDMYPHAQVNKSRSRVLLREYAEPMPQTLMVPCTVHPSTLFDVPAAATAP